ncbi:MAG: hypothetical protein HY862_09170 [Chloroflexi bacterium]|nr:hypothetical protein [Chloroflexota bacterium]
MQPDTHAPLDQAILMTLLYADVFSFPMTALEIHHFLIGRPASLEEIELALATPSAWLAQYIEVGTLNQQRVYAIIKSESQNKAIFEKRQQRDLASTELWPKARRYGMLLGHMPFVRMVAITGALAVRNAGSPQDDLDYLLVVKHGRVWLARLGAVVMVKACKVLGVTLCPNYVLAETALAQDRLDLFMAHELTQMIPLTGQTVYQKMRLCNDWADVMLPNAQTPFYIEKDATPRRIGRWVQIVLELALSGPVGNWLEDWERRRKIRKFHNQATQSTDTVLDAEHVKGHFFDYGSRTLQRFQKSLETYDLARLYEMEQTGEVFSPAAD